MLVDLNSFHHGVQKLSVGCTYAPIETDQEHFAETIYKLITELDLIQLVKQLIGIILSMRKNGSEDNIRNSFLECGLQRNITKKIIEIHFDLQV